MFRLGRGFGSAGGVSFVKLYAAHNVGSVNLII